MTDIATQARQAGEADGCHDGVNAHLMNPRPPLQLIARSDDAITAYQHGYTVGYATGYTTGRDMRDALLRAKDLNRDLNRAFGRE